MATEATSTAIAALVVACGLSLAALFYLFQKHVDGRPLLQYEPRRRVPWGPGVALLAMILPMMSILAAVASGFQTEAPPPSSQSILVVGWTDFAVKLLFVAAVMSSLATFLGADARDLGLPTSWRQLAQDVGIGAFAAIAALLPIHAVQWMLMFTLDSDTQHPLVTQLEENHSPAMLVLGFAMAVISAPLFEEFAFRGLLQGWLERCEDEVLRHGATLRHTPIDTESDEAETIDTEMIDDHSVNNRQLFATSTDSVVAELTQDGVRPPHGWIPDLPHGWTPILLSAVVFGLAHLGHGVAPISLVLFGIVLGYVYQRTHRLAPSIAAHMLFNAYSMFLLWLQLEAPPPG